MPILAEAFYITCATANFKGNPTSRYYYYFHFADGDTGGSERVKHLPKVSKGENMRNESELDRVHGQGWPLWLLFDEVMRHSIRALGAPTPH